MACFVVAASALRRLTASSERVLSRARRLWLHRRHGSRRGKVVNPSVDGWSAADGEEPSARHRGYRHGGRTVPAVGGGRRPIGAHPTGEEIVTEMGDI